MKKSAVRVAWLLLCLLLTDHTFAVHTKLRSGRRTVVANSLSSATQSETSTGNHVVTPDPRHMLTAVLAKVNHFYGQLHGTSHTPWGCKSSTSATHSAQCRAASVAIGGILRELATLKARLDSSFSRATLPEPVAPTIVYAEPILEVVNAFAAQLAGLVREYRKYKDSSLAAFTELPILEYVIDGTITYTRQLRGLLEPVVEAERAGVAACRASAWFQHNIIPRLAMDANPVTTILFNEELATSTAARAETVRTSFTESPIKQLKLEEAGLVLAEARGLFRAVEVEGPEDGVDDAAEDDETVELVVLRETVEAAEAQIQTPIRDALTRFQAAREAAEMTVAEVRIRLSDQVKTELGGIITLLRSIADKSIVRPSFPTEMTEQIQALELAPLYSDNDLRTEAVNQLTTIMTAVGVIFPVLSPDQQSVGSVGALLLQVSERTTLLEALLGTPGAVVLPDDTAPSTKDIVLSRLSEDLSRVIRAKRILALLSGFPGLRLRQVLKRLIAAVVELDSAKDLQRAEMELFREDAHRVPCITSVVFQRVLRGPLSLFLADQDALDRLTGPVSEGQSVYEMCDNDNLLAPAQATVQDTTARALKLHNIQLTLARVREEHKSTGKITTNLEDARAAYKQNVEEQLGLDPRDFQVLATHSKISDRRDLRESTAFLFPLAHRLRRTVQVTTPGIYFAMGSIETPITVNRADVIETAFRLSSIQQRMRDATVTALSVQFENEEGIDMGALRREFFRLAGDIIAQRYLSAERTFNKPDALAEDDFNLRLRFTGHLIATAFYDHRTMDLGLPLTLYREIAARLQVSVGELYLSHDHSSLFYNADSAVDFSMLLLQTDSPDDFLSVSQLKNQFGSLSALTLAGLSPFCLSRLESFADRTLLATNNVETTDELLTLLNVEVVYSKWKTSEDFAQWKAKDLLFQKFLAGPTTERRVNSLFNGFFEPMLKQTMAIPGIRRTIATLSPFDFKEALEGVDTINLDEWYAATEFRRMQPQLKQAFWAAITSLTEPERKSYMYFITGTPRLPPGGFASLARRFVLIPWPRLGEPQAKMFVDEQVGAFPSAHSCFFQLDVPTQIYATRAGALLYNGYRDSEAIPESTMSPELYAKVVHRYAELIRGAMLLNQGFQTA